MELEYRRNIVFDLPLSEDYSKGRILDLRINWRKPTTLSGAELTEAETLANGQTILYSANDNKLIFLAKHPLNNQYYRLEMDIDIQHQLREPYLVTIGIYSVSEGPYYVQARSIDPGIFVVATADVYALIDVASTGGSWFVSNTVEPFNTIFFPNIDETPVAPIISGATTHTSGGLTTRFTNTPTSSGLMLDTQYSLSLQDGALTFSRTVSDVEPVTAGGIQSINGIIAQGGNINIKVLGNG